MSIRIKYTIECSCCGGTASYTSLDLSNPQPDGSIVVDIEMAGTQSDFECEECDCVTGTGDLYTELHDESVCTKEESDL